MTATLLNENEMDLNREVLAEVRASALRTSKAAREVFDALRDGEISVADATELSNALGKANGADSNAIKAIMTGMILDKMELNHKTRALELSASQH